MSFLMRLLLVFLGLLVAVHVLGAAGVDVGCLDDLWIRCIADWLGWSV